MSEESSGKGWPGRRPDQPDKPTTPGVGSALIQTLAEMPRVVDALTEVVRSGGFGDRDVFGIRLALEEAIRHALKHGPSQEGLSRLRVRYHLGPEGLLLELEDEKRPALPDRHTENYCERSLDLMRHLMTEVRLGEHGRVFLYKRRPLRSA